MKTYGWMAASAVATALVISGCGTPATYDEKMAYLNKVALRGVEVHDLITSQEGKVDAERCEAAFDSLQEWNDAPSDTNSGGWTTVWREQIKLFFVDSCVSGVPRDIPAPGSPSPSQK